MTFSLPTVRFPDQKTRRTCVYYLRQFARKKALLIPTSLQDRRDLLQERGLTKQYRSDKGKTYYPTTAGWDAFLQFSHILHLAEPFATHATQNDTFQATLNGFANMLADGLLPVQLDDLLEYLPESFVSAVTARVERRFCKLQGLNLSGSVSFAVGNCWIGNYKTLNLDTISGTEADFRKGVIDTLNGVFERDSTFIAGSCVQGTAERVKDETAFQWDLTLSIVCLFLNLSYKSVFQLLWQVRILDKPESGFSKQHEFSLIGDGNSKQQLSISTQFLGQWFDLEGETISVWHEHLGLNIFNRLILQEQYRDNKLVSKIVSALLYFRQAANQSSLEMQMSTLWVSVEVFFTANNENITNTNVEKLVHVTVETLDCEHWPNKAKSVDELTKTFKKFYAFRSSTLHHGKRGHVTARDVQEFSQVVGAVILGAAFTVWEREG